MFVNVRDHEMQKGSLEDSLRALPTCAYIEGGVGGGSPPQAICALPTYFYSN